MTMNEARPAISKALQALGSTVSQRIVTGLTLAIVGFMATTGKGMIRSVYAEETREILRPNLDTLQTQIDTLKVSTKATAQAVERMQQMQLEMYSAQLQRDTGLQRILENRANNSRKAAEDKAKTENLFKALTGESR